MRSADPIIILSFHVYSGGAKEQEVTVVIVE
jgi:hypothetical protein